MIPFVFFRTAKMHFSQRELPSPYLSYIVIHSSLAFHEALRNTFFEVLLSLVVRTYPRAHYNEAIENVILGPSAYGFGTIPIESIGTHLPIPRYGQYLTHAHNHITRAVAAMDSCYAFVGAHHHGIAVGSMSRITPRIKDPSLPRRVQALL